MDLLWPVSLLLLAFIPVILAAYFWILRRRRRLAVHYSSLLLVREALPQNARLRRHLPFALFLSALASLVLALSRPVAIVQVPTGQATIILALDVSRSMCQTDIPPSRLDAAKAAALSFIQSQPASTQIGVVAFAGFAEVILPPTNDQELLQDAVESLLTARRTAIGSAILKSLDVIAEFDASVPPSVTGAGSQPPPVAQGAYVPHIIVVLTDGVSNAGPEPVEAAQQAADRGVRVYTIGFGTASGSPGRLCGQQFQNNVPPGGQLFGPDPFGGGGGGGFRRGIDEEALKEVADMTGGEYYSAESASELHEVFRNLPTYLIARHETMEISVAFTAIGALAAALAILLSLRWHPLP